MTDYWVSSKKHYCEVCKCWLSGSSQNVKKHESSGRHISSLRNKMIESHKKKVEKRRQEEFEAEEMKRLNSITLDNPVPTETSKNMPFISSMFSYGPLIQPTLDVESEKKRIMNTINRTLAGIEQPEHVELKSKSTSRKNLRYNTLEWIATIDQDDGSLVYYNNYTGVRTKNRPRDFDGVLPLASTSLTSNWILKYDPNKRCRYYHNVDTGEVRWLDEKPISQEVPVVQGNDSVIRENTLKPIKKPDIEIKFKKETEPQYKGPPIVKHEEKNDFKSEESGESYSKSETNTNDYDLESKEKLAPVIGQWEVVNPKDSVFSHCVENMESFVVLEEKKTNSEHFPDRTSETDGMVNGNFEVEEVYEKPTYIKDQQSSDDSPEGQHLFKKRKIPKKNQ